MRKHIIVKKKVSKIEFSTVFAKKKFPKWDQNVKIKEGSVEPRVIKTKPKKTWQDLQAFVSLS